MNHPLPYQLLADLVLALHAGVVVFVVGGLVLVVSGNLLGWRWVNALWFRLLHVAAIGAVAVEAWLGVACPLTTLEMQLRASAHATIYEQGFLEHWLQRLLYYEAPAWAFTLAYSLFAVAVIVAWWWYPPRCRRPAHRNRDTGSE